MTDAKPATDAKPVTDAKPATDAKPETDAKPATEAKPFDNERVIFDSMRHAITDAQQMIRAYDTKAQVLIAYLTFAVGTILRQIDESRVTPFVLGLGIIAIIAAFALCACVLYPRAPSSRRQPKGEFTPSNTYYLSPAMLRLPPQELVARVRATDWLAELVHELRKLAMIRQRKAFWFKWAFITSGLSVVGFYAVLLFGELFD